MLEVWSTNFCSLWTSIGRPDKSDINTAVVDRKSTSYMDVQYGIWTDVPNKDVLWTSRGRAMFIGIKVFQARGFLWARFF